MEHYHIEEKFYVISNCHKISFMSHEKFTLLNSTFSHKILDSIYPETANVKPNFEVFAKLCKITKLKEKCKNGD